MIAKAGLKATNASAAAAIKAGHAAVMHRWLISAQKLRRRPSAMTSRPPIRTIRDLDFCSLGVVAILFESLRALGSYLMACATCTVSISISDHRYFGKRPIM